jgi:predicted CDP-diglyceride synthetase/phosphatidate cytidylyltransferase
MLNKFDVSENTVTMLAVPLATRCNPKVVYFHHVGIMTFKDYLNLIITDYKNKTKFFVVPTFWVGGLIEDCN